MPEDLKWVDDNDRWQYSPVWEGWCSHCFEWVDVLDPAWDYLEGVFCEVCVRYEPCGGCE